MSMSCALTTFCFSFSFIQRPLTLPGPWSPARVAPLAAASCDSRLLRAGHGAGTWEVQVGAVHPPETLQYAPLFTLNG